MMIYTCLRLSNVYQAYTGHIYTITNKTKNSVNYLEHVKDGNFILKYPPLQQITN